MQQRDSLAHGVIGKLPFAARGVRRRRGIAAAMLLALAGCNVSEHRHTFELAAGRDVQVVYAWLRPADSGPGSLWLDTLLFPLDFVASSWTCAQAIWSDDVAVTYGPLGWLATALPVVSANWYGDAAKVAMPIKPFAPDAQPFRVAVSHQDLAALRAAQDGGERTAAFDRAVLRALPPGQAGGSGRHWLLDQRFWQEAIRPGLAGVELVVRPADGR
jgi:hypothetical protein